MGLRRVQSQPCPWCCSLLHMGMLGISPRCQHTPPWAQSSGTELLVTPQSGPTRSILEAADCGHSKLTQIHLRQA